MRQRSFDYLPKPFGPSLLVDSVSKALEHQELVVEDQRIKLHLRRCSDPDIFAGSSSVMRELNRLLRPM